MPERRLIQKISLASEKTDTPWMNIQEWVPKTYKYECQKGDEFMAPGNLGMQGIGS